jgi:phosphatidylcholine synthase
MLRDRVSERNAMSEPDRAKRIPDAGSEAPSRGNADRVRSLEDARRRGLAWGVHAFTASGAVVGAIALLAVGAGNWQQAAILMLVALVIDSADGTLARAAHVREVLPDIDGRRLDDMVDYLNYVIVPVVFLVAAGYLHPAVAAAPILASAYGFSLAEAKTEDDFFLGFPSYWNIVALYIWLLDVSELTATLVVVALAIGVFVPLKYLYPSKMPVGKAAMGVLGVAWVIGASIAVVARDATASWHLAEITLAYPALYLGLSFWFGGLHRKPS